jgi:hypothetical protein
MLASSEPRSVLPMVAVWFTAELIRSQNLTAVFKVTQLLEVAAIFGR